MESFRFFQLVIQLAIVVVVGCMLIAIVIAMAIVMTHDCHRDTGST